MLFKTQKKRIFKPLLLLSAMKKRILVLSLGGSLIVPEHEEIGFLHHFKQTIERYYDRYQFVLVCGGGIVARRYINALKQEHLPEKQLSLAGIRATRMNATFVMQLFGKEANGILPKNIQEVQHALHKNNVVVCGALRFVPRSTSDGTAARIAHVLGSEFINLTDVPGLYTANPHMHKNAVFIPRISWKEFEKKALALKHKPGQHFVLDQEAAVIIRKHRIPTTILNQDLENLKKFLDNKPFVGTLIVQ